LWNSSGLVYSSFREISGVENSSIFEYSFADEGEYTWGCSSMNNASYLAEENSTIVYDITFPEINSSILTKTSDSAVFTWQTNESTNYSIDLQSKSSSEFSISHSVTFSGLASGTAYSYNLTFCDSAGNCNYSLGSFTTDSVSDGGGSGGGSGGGGGGGGGSPAILSQSPVLPKFEVFTPSDEQISSGSYKISVKNLDKVVFKIYDEKSEEHIISVDSVGNDSVSLTIRSEPISVVLGKGQSRKLNISSNDYYDLLLKLEDIQNGSAQILIQTIKEQMHPREVVTEKVVREIDWNILIYFAGFISLVLLVADFFYERWKRKKIKKEIMNEIAKK
jgi:hypothetical protein